METWNHEREAAFIRQARRIVADLLVHRPAIYWVDFLLSAAFGYAALSIYLLADNFSAAQILGFVLAGILLYRASIFTHELTHIPIHDFLSFRFAWNLLFGVPFLMPSFLYSNHRGHHLVQTYGTDGDSEYYPFPEASAGHWFMQCLAIVISPLLPVARFGLLTPLGWISPRWRDLIWERASSLGNLNPAYRRPPPDAHDRKTWRWLEAGCFVVVWTGITLVATGIWTGAILAKLALLYFVIVLVNHIRTFAAHHYNSGGTRMTFLQQMLDSTTIPGGPWTELWAPLGMRYHALHHLFPSMPYHSMGQAHLRLMRELPADSPYHGTVLPSLAVALSRFVRACNSTPPVSQSAANDSHSSTVPPP